MNGRCQKDALDRAEDICELCGHQFCAQCLLFPRGHRNPPTCKTCALQHSGIRGGATKAQSISKREYKKRKKELFAQLEDVEEQAPAIEFFELKDPSKFDQSTELDRRPTVVEKEPSIDILAASDDAPAPVPPGPRDAPAPQRTESVPSAELDPVDHAVAGLAPVDTSVNPLALLAEAPSVDSVPPPSAQADQLSEPTSSAADLLARLKADQPIQSQFNAAPVGLDTDPFATPTSGLVAPEPEVPTPPSEVPAPTTSAPNASPRPKSEPWSPPTPPPRGTNLDSMGGEPDSAGVPAAAAPQQQVPAPQQQAPIQASPIQPVSPEAAPFAAAPLEVTPDDAPPFAETEPQAVAPPVQIPAKRGADTDESGQWIPPSLRGMAAPEERDPLPKRRR